MSSLTRDGTAEPVSRDEKIGNLTRSILPLLYMMTIRTFIHMALYMHNVLLNCGRPGGSVGNLETF